MLAERDGACRTLLQEAGYWPLDRLEVLEIGCGDGRNLGRLVEWGADPARLHGWDVDPERIGEAKRRWPALDLQVTDATSAELRPASIDLVLLFTVLSSVLDDGVARSIADKARSALRPDGSILWYDFTVRNPRNRHTRGMRRRDIGCLFPGFRLELRRMTLLPPLARRLGDRADALYPLLARLPFLQGHYLGLLRPPCP